MTPQEQREYWFRWQRFQRRYEDIYTVKIYNALKQQLQQFIDTRDILYVSSTPLYTVIVDLYKTVGPLWAAFTNSKLPRRKSRMPMGFSERIIQLMQQYYGIDLLNMAEGITDTTRQIIAEILSKASITGASIDEIVKEIERLAVNRKRARLIARTETVTAANSAAIINAKEKAKEFGLEMNKIWIATNDNRTRNDHRSVNQMVVGIDDPFNVGGYQMQQPGDRGSKYSPTPAKEICNCRCTIAFIPKD